MVNGKKLSTTKKCAIVTIVGCVLMVTGITTSVLCVPTPDAAASGPASLQPQQKKVFLIDEPTPLGGKVSSSLPAVSIDEEADNTEVASTQNQSTGQRTSAPSQSASNSDTGEQQAGFPPEQNVSSAADADVGDETDTAAYEAAKAHYQQKEAAAQTAYSAYLTAQSTANAAVTRAGTLYSACTSQQPAVDAAYNAYKVAEATYTQLLRDDPANVAAQEAARAETEKQKGAYETLNSAYGTALSTYNAYLASAEYTDAQTQAQNQKTAYETANAEMEAAKQAWLALKG